MSSKQSSDVKFEIGRVLFIDIVGYSKLLINEQSEQIQKLKEIVCGTEQFRTAEAEGKLAKRQYVNTTAFATIYLGLGEKEKALDWLDKSYQDQESACWYLKVDPIYDSVRNEPRFQALLTKVGLDQ
jgi:hypothetical protein